MTALARLLSIPRHARPGLLFVAALLVACAHDGAARFPDPHVERIDVHDPAWTADGLIGFYANATGDFEVYTVRPDGSDLERLTHNPGNDGEPDWCRADGRLTYGSQRDGAERLVVADSDGRGERWIDTGGVGVSSPRWSPDGSRIAFEGRIGDNRELFSIAADGSDRIRLTDHPDRDFRPSWSPDGDRIVFQSNRSGRYQLHVMRADGADPRLLAALEGNASGPRWSPDGADIVFVGDASGDEELYRIAPDGTGLVRLTHHPGPDTAAAWSPDGEWIAFVSETDGVPGICVMSRDGAGRRLVVAGRR